MKPKAPISIHEKMVREKHSRMKRRTEKSLCPARCKKVLAILNNKLETCETIREETWLPFVQDETAADGYRFVVVGWPGHPDWPPIHVPMSTVVFLKD
jgi:hypothetical protein